MKDMANKKRYKKVPKYILVANGKIAGKLRAKRVQNLTTDEIFESARTASKNLGFSIGMVTTAIYQGSRAGGDYWKYI